MKLSKQHLYWLLQIIGWGILFGLNSVGKLFIGNSKIATTYIILEFIITLTLGISCSHLFRWIYKYKIEWSRWSWSKFFATALTLLLCSLIMVFFTELFCTAAYNLIQNKTLDVSSSHRLITFLNGIVYLIFWFICYLGINYFMRYQQMKVERLQLENTAKESQLNTLKGQINPHFMFNSLNNIRGLMLEDVDKARDMLTQLSEMLRFSLARENDNFVPLREEIAVVRNYIALSKIQLEDRLQYDEVFLENIMELEVPPMLIQMLVENAIKHGVSDLKNGGMVALQVQRTVAFLEIKVVNDGRLNTKTSGTKVGVENIEQRLQLLYNRKASFVLQEENDKVVATVQLPLA